MHSSDAVTGKQTHRCNQSRHSSPAGSSFRSRERPAVPFSATLSSSSQSSSLSAAAFLDLSHPSLATLLRSLRREADSAAPASSKSSRSNAGRHRGADSAFAASLPAAALGASNRVASRIRLRMAKNSSTSSSVTSSVVAERRRAAGRTAPTASPGSRFLLLLSAAAISIIEAVVGDGEK
ncbi:uncharacterized protein LOC122010663 [Zingiber officinale]|uniref:uncharacterized protein LOC122010663 n=1 Tax=Zingiber officinale TaxID=94328 RepID=UPI001C4A8FEB|nr:uncharacterized protein LOC122010663 [Zingiber officinale]